MQARQQVLALARQYDFEQNHSFQDAKLALLLFNETYDLHSLDDEYADLLEYAAILHDIGYWYDYEDHHKHAYQMIMAAELPALSDREKAIVANIARYHRSARPKLKHKGFAALEPDDREIVTRLASILRFADGLDRSHTNAVKDLAVEYRGDTMILWIYPPHGNELERWAGQKKSEFFQDVFEIDVRVLPARSIQYE
ncbi:MAG: HD domain-containing protein [Anaerolineales bacterium]|nr:HD domain-containing protein [Anaerolineales bacterium]